MTPDEAAALDVARRLAASGIPIFIAKPDASTKTGFRPPPRWERTVPDPAVVDLWQPGLALCAVMGCGLDLIDFDPRNGGDPSALNGLTPQLYGLAGTPSGGIHGFIASLGVGSRDNVLPGIDVKGGIPDGSSRGFAFIAPTVRVSAVTGEPAAYRWHQVPDLSRLGGQDTSGTALATRIRELRTSHETVRGAGGPQWWQQFMAQREPQSAPAAEKAIEGKLAEVAGWTTESGIGFRTVLLRAALTLGGYVGGGYLEELDARERLEKVVGAVWGTPDADDLLWIQQGLDDGAVRPFFVFTPEQERTHSEAALAVARQGEMPPAPGGPAQEPPWSVFGVLGAEPFDPAGDNSDQGLAKAVAGRMYPALRYATDAGLWIKRDRHVWEECAEDMSDWIVSVLAERMPLGQTPVPREITERTEGHWQAVRRATFMSSQGTGKVGRKLRALVKSDHPASLRIADLDAHPEVLWAGGVPWDLRASGDIPTPAGWIDPATPHLRTAVCAPDPAVPTPRWDAFLAAVLPDPEVRAWALRVLSIALTGYPDAALPILWGRERSGKTSLVEMLVELLGSYAHAANPKLLSSQDNSHDTILYDLKGRRLSFIDEGPKRGHDATERLKQLTGGGRLNGRAMRANSVSFKPTHTVVMTTNPEPNLTDPALRARVRLIPCDTPEEIVKPLRVALLGNGLIAEAPGILAAMMRETAAWLADRDTATTAAAPISIRGLADEIAEGQDPIKEWVETCTIPTEPGTPGRTLYSQLFARWHQDHPRYRRLSLPSETAFGRRLTELGYPVQPIGRLKYRPLSVLNGGFGPTPQPPNPTQFMGAPTGGGSSGSGLDAGSTRVGAGYPANPLGVEIPAQGALSDRSGAGYAGFSSEQKTEPQKVGAEEKSAEGEPQPATRETPTRKLPPTSENNPSGLASDNPLPPAPVVPPARRPSSVTGRYTKAAAKAAEKEAARQASAGESTRLPVLVDRAGAITALDPGRVGAEVAAAVTRAGALTVDVETSGYPVGHADYVLRTVQLGDEQAAVVLDPADPAQADVVRAALAGAPALHAHSATADLVPLVHAGLADESAWERMRDTVIPAKLADPSSTGSDPGLKQLAGTVLNGSATAPEADKARALMFKVNGWLKDIKAATPLERNGWAQVDSTSSTMIRYAASDVLDTAALATRLPQPPAEVVERERAVQRITARVAHRGVRIDREQVARLQTEHQPAMEAAAAQVRTLGVENPGSDRQLADRLTELGVQLPRTQPSTKFPQGQTSVAAGVLEGLRNAPAPAGDLIAAVLDYRHHETVLTTFLEPYRVLCESGDSRARPTVYTLGTVTGRMSCVQSDALIEMPRDLAKYPDGVPITEVQAGDWVYAFDHRRELVLRRVKWCAQTGVRQTLVITAENSAGHRLTLRATPEHLIRLRNGDWRATEGLMHMPGRPHREDGPRLMTMVRRQIDDGYIKFFPHSVARLGAGVRGGGKSREHRWILEQVTGKRLSTKVDVDHIDGNRANNHPDNLRALPMTEHRGNRSLAWGVEQAALELPMGPTDYHVISVEPGPIEPVWDMEVEGVHNFIANGICVHNCVRPNLQQLPREGGVRACITADPGQLLVSADFSGVEIRVMAALSQDPELIRQLREGVDLHAMVAEMAFGPGWTKGNRYTAKRGVFGWAYGGKPENIAKQLGVSAEVMFAIVDALRQIAPQYVAWADEVKRAVRGGATQMPTYAGRVIHLDRQLPHKAPNACIQGTARELLVDALLEWDQTPWGGGVVLPVHDEIVAVVPEPDATEATAALVRCMSRELYGISIVAEASEPAFAWRDSA